MQRHLPPDRAVDTTDRNFKTAEASAAPALTACILVFQKLCLKSQQGPNAEFSCQLSALHWHYYQYSAFLQPFIVIRSFYFLVASLPFFLTLPVPSLFHRAGSPAHSQLVRMSAAAQQRCWCSGKTGWTPQPTCGVSWSLWATTRHMF